MGHKKVSVSCFLKSRFLAVQRKRNVCNTAWSQFHGKLNGPFRGKLNGPLNGKLNASIYNAACFCAFLIKVNY